MNEDYDAEADLSEAWHQWRRPEAGPFWGIIGALGWIASRDSSYVTTSEHDTKPIMLSVLQRSVPGGGDALSAASRDLIYRLGNGELSASQLLDGGARVYVDQVLFADAQLTQHGEVRLLNGVDGMRFAAADIRRLWPATSGKAISAPPLPAAELKRWIGPKVAEGQAADRCFQLAQAFFVDYHVSRSQVRTAWHEEMSRAGKAILPGRKSGKSANCAAN